MGLGFLKNLIGPALGMAGGMTGIPGLGQLGSALGGAIGGGLKTKGNAKAQQQQYIDALRANRPDQSNPFGSLSWTEGPGGKWSQNVTMNPEDQKRLDMFRQIAASRLGQAGKIGLPTGAIDYDKMGLGSLAAAAGIGQGSTGKRPWADSPYASMGGNMLRNLQWSQPTQIPSWMNMMSSSPIGMGGGGGGPPPPGPAPMAPQPNMRVAPTFRGA